MAFLGGARRVDALARETGAFERARKVDGAETLLRLILMWAVAERSIMDTAALAAEAGFAEISDVALVERFAKADAWLGALVSDLLVKNAESLPRGVRVRVLDATSITRAARSGGVHIRRRGGRRDDDRDIAVCRSAAI